LQVLTCIGSHLMRFPSPSEKHVFWPFCIFGLDSEVFVFPKALSFYPMKLHKCQISLILFFSCTCGLWAQGNSPWPLRIEFQPGFEANAPLQNAIRDVSSLLHLDASASANASVILRCRLQGDRLRAPLLVQSLPCLPFLTIISASSRLILPDSSTWS
jgi:hypothetical protein